MIELLFNVERYLLESRRRQFQQQVFSESHRGVKGPPLYLNETPVPDFQGDEKKSIRLK